MWPEIELREIRVFLMVAEELHFGRAAERLQINRSRVSQIIKTLELRIGARLFERTSRRVRLTPVGMQLRVKIAPVYEQLQRLLEETREAAGGVTGTLRIGAYSIALLGEHMAEIIEVFEARHPGCNVTYVDTGFERDYLDWLRAGDVDIVACWLPVSPSEFTAGPLLMRGKRILIVAPDHPLAQRESVSYEDLADCLVTDAAGLNREMMDVLIPPVTPSGVRLRRVARRTFEEALMRVATGEQVHVTVASFLEHYKGPPLATVPFSDLPPSEAVLAWRTADDRSAKIQAFARAAADVLARTELAAHQPPTPTHTSPTPPTTGTREREPILS
jgi:DNA-binding transcriptional LysR family regulator